MNPGRCCPLLSVGDELKDCIQEKCVWFKESQCVVCVMNTHLTDIVNNTSYIYVQDTTNEIGELLKAVVKIDSKLKS